MPRKGLPYCKCGWCNWRLVEANPSRTSALLLCRNCKTVVRSRSQALSWVFPGFRDGAYSNKGSNIPGSP